MFSNAFPNTASRMHLFILLNISTLLSLSSMLSLVLKCAALFTRRDLINQHRSASDSSLPVIVGSNNSLAMFPLHLNEGAAGPVIATAALSLTLSLVAVVFACRSLSTGPLMLSPRQHISILSVMLAHYLLTTGTLIYTFIIHQLSDHFDPNYRADPYDRGTFDPETWTCEMHAWHNFQGLEDTVLRRQCTFEKASRWVSVCIVVLSIGFGAVSTWALVAEKAIIIAKNKVKARMADHDSEYDSPSVYSR